MEKEHETRQANSRSCLELEFGERLTLARNQRAVAKADDPHINVGRREDTAAVGSGVSVPRHEVSHVRNRMSSTDDRCLGRSYVRARLWVGPEVRRMTEEYSPRAVMPVTQGCFQLGVRALAD